MKSIISIIFAVIATFIGLSVSVSNDSDKGNALADNLTYESALETSTYVVTTTSTVDTTTTHETTTSTTSTSTDTTTTTSTTSATTTVIESTEELKQTEPVQELIETPSVEETESTETAVVETDAYVEETAVPTEEPTIESTYVETEALATEAVTTNVCPVTGYELYYSAAYSVDSSPLTKRMGVKWFGGHKETYYDEKVLPGPGLNIPGRHVADDGTIRDENGYICVASDLSYLSRGSVVLTSRGPAKVYDTGCAWGTIDIYVNW